MTYALPRVWQWAARPLAALVLGLACSHDTSSATDTGNGFTVHCADDLGDATCQLAFPAKPFCNACVDKSHDLGCVSTPPPPGCSPDGTSQDGSGDDGPSDSSSGSGSSTSGADSSTGIPADTTSSVDSTGPEFACEEEGQLDEDCEALDPSRPYCIGATCVGCNDIGGDPFCVLVDATRPACDESTSVCVGCEAGGVGFCQGVTPACDATGACVPCSSHADCPDSACHLSGDDLLVGSCFSADENVWVDRAAICPGMGTEATPSCSLAGTLAGIPSGGNAVIHLVAGTPYDEQAIAADASVAILGTGGVPELVGEAGLDEGSLSVLGAVVYIEGVRIVGNLESHGISCASGSVWLDQSEVRENNDYGIFLSGPCNVTLRRAGVHNNAGGGIRQFGGALVLDNAIVGQNGDGVHGPGINLQFADFTALYSTIAGNDGVGNDSIQCLDATGRIRNSIVTGASETSVDLDCFMFDFETNAIDTGPFAPAGSVEVAAYDDFWFLDPDAGDFRLANPVFTPFGAIALWTDGDPVLDADGTMRPQGGELGYAGADEP